jgi:4-amino-4-deoxy-L-arabinose transferase-like glycosyltransferase
MEEDDKEIKERKARLNKFFLSWVKDNYDKLFIGVLIFAFLLRIWIFIITKNQTLWFDAAEYLSTAKHWAGIGNMTDIWYYRRGFFWPLFCSVFFKFGLGDAGVRFVTVLFSTGIIAVSYFLIKDMFNKKYALFACIGLSMSWVFLFFTGRPMTDIPSAFFLLISLWFFWKGYELKQGNKFLYFSAFFFSVSVLTRMQNLMFIPVFFVFIFIKEKFSFLKNRSLWKALLVFALVMSPVFILYYHHFGNPITDILSWYFGIQTGNAPVQASAKTLGNIPMYLLDLPYNLTNPVCIAFVIGFFYFFVDLFLGIDKVFSDKNVQKKLLVLFWVFFPLLLLGYMSVYPEQRYTMMQHPFFFMIAAVPFFKIEDFLAKNIKINKKFLSFLIFAGFIVLLIPNLLWAHQLTELKKTSYYELKLAGEWIKENSIPGDMVVTNSFPQISYYSERKVATFGDCYNNPEAHTPPCTPEEFNSFVEDVKPKFMILSIFEDHEEWMFDYPQNHSDVWHPVQAYKQGDQPVLVIYQADYMNIS